MGISGCKSCNCNKNEKYNEINSQIISPKVNNIQPQIIENKDINKDKDSLNYSNAQKGIIPLSTTSKNNINSFQNQLSKDNNITNSQRENKNEELKQFIKKLDIRNIYFPLIINTVTNKDQEKIQTILNKFYPCDDKQINLLENGLINILYSIKDIVRKNMEDENIIHNGNLKKLISSDLISGNFKTMKYSDRYCVLYPDIIKYYKSEVQFLKNLKPLSVIYLNQISRVNLVKDNKNSKKIDHLILCNNYGLKNENMNVYNNNEPFINNESLIIFTSDNEQDIHEWFIIIQYLIENNKN
jgi:hypothetical protein